jgi:uncharacterized membrane protein
MTNDDAVERSLGHLLRAGVILSACVVAAGGVLFLLRHHAAISGFATFEGEPKELRSLTEIVRGASRWQGRSLIQLGVVLLVATPVARVVFSAFAFARQRDWLYVALTGIVLALLLYSLFS